MRRVVLIVILVALVLLDISLIPMALMLIFLGGLLGSVRHGFWVSMVIFPLLVGGVLSWLTVRVGRAVRQR